MLTTLLFGLRLRINQRVVQAGVRAVDEPGARVVRGAAVLGLIMRGTENEPAKKILETIHFIIPVPAFIL